MNGQVAGKMEGQNLDKLIVMFVGRILKWISELVTVLLFLGLPPTFSSSKYCPPEWHNFFKI